MDSWNELIARVTNLEVARDEQYLETERLLERVRELERRVDAMLSSEETPTHD